MTGTKIANSVIKNKVILKDNETTHNPSTKKQSSKAQNGGNIPHSNDQGLLSGSGTSTMCLTTSHLQWDSGAMN